MELLAGGVANAGAVVRDGDVVLRPAPPDVHAVHELFRALHLAGFEGVPRPADPPLAPDGRERLAFVPGDVAVTPFPPWSHTDEVLASVGRLLRRYHDAVASVPVPPALRRPTAMADPEGGPVLCHNDVCPENVVVAGGEATCLLDFDFAAPGRPLWDVATTARMWVPVAAPEHARRLGFPGTDPAPRLRVLADAYGLDDADRSALPELILRSLEVGHTMVMANVEAGHPAFVAMWAAMGGEEAYRRRRDWLAANLDRLRTALTRTPR